MKDLQDLINFLEPDNTFLDEPLSKHTTLRIGGPADVLYRAKNIEELIRVIRRANELSIPVTILGWGSNVLVSDKGIRGLVIKNETGEIEISKDVPSPTAITVPPLRKYKEGTKKILSRWQSDSEKGTFKYEFGDLDYDESGFPRVRVSMDSGVSLPKAINSLIEEGVTGLQWYARIPGTIGGAVFNNIHGGTHFISEVIKSVRTINKSGVIKEFSGKELGLAYDKSRFHDSEEIILEVEFELFKGDVLRAKEVAMEWAKRKSLQPPRSAGCTFKNISNGDKERLNFPTTSAGYIVEHVLKLGGRKVGGAKISTAHHNFIVNDGGATARDYMELLNLIRDETKKMLKIDLVPEMILLGEF